MLSNQQVMVNQLQPITYKKNAHGEISIGGVPVKDLAAQYQTPLYVLCQKTIQEKINEYKEAFNHHYPNHQIIYASKALNCKALCQLMAKENIGLDVVSAGELYTALSVSFPTDRIIFHGNNKSAEEINMCIEHGVTIILDNYHDLKLIQELASKPVRVIIRVTPGIECHTHEYIKTGMIDSKFGFKLEEVIGIVKKIHNEIPQINLLGLHCHIGSQIFETIPHQDAARILLTKYQEVKNQLGTEFEVLNIGGGLGVKYQENDDPPAVSDWVKTVTSSVKNSCHELQLKPPKLMTEPGRSLVGNAGITVYTVGNIKDIPDLRKYVCVDGGMADNVRHIMYQARYSAEFDGKSNQEPKETVTIAGKYCESGDVLIKDISLPKANSGDLLVVYTTGAYNYSMASNYNRATKPAMVMVKDGHSQVIIKRESLDDLLVHDCELT